MLLEVVKKFASYKKVLLVDNKKMLSKIVLYRNETKAKEVGPWGDLPVRRLRYLSSP